MDYLSPDKPYKLSDDVLLNVVIYPIIFGNLGLWSKERVGGEMEHMRLTNDEVRRITELMDNNGLLRKCKSRWAYDLKPFFNSLS